MSIVPASADAEEDGWIVLLSRSVCGLLVFSHGQL